MRNFVVCCLAPKICIKRAVDFIFGKLAADTARSKIVCVIAHASIFPVNEIVLVVLIDKEIEVKEVIVAKAFWCIIGLYKALQFIDFGGHFPVAWNVDGTFFQKK